MRLTNIFNVRVKFPYDKLVPASGGTPDIKGARKTIRLVQYGCANRPFYHIIVNMSKRHMYDKPIEQLGTYDPIPNMFNEKLCSLNLERIQHWVGEGAKFSRNVACLLGYCGFLPIHPVDKLKAWKNEKNEKEKETEKESQEIAEN